MNLVLLILVISYLIIAKQNNWFPFNEEKNYSSIPPKQNLNNYSLSELRQAYLKKLSESTNLTPELIQLERSFADFVKKVNQLVHIEYPQATWHFVQHNVGASLILNTKVEINIFTYDCFVEKRTVLVKNRQAYMLEPIINVASPDVCDDICEKFNTKKESNSIKDNNKNNQKNFVTGQDVEKDNTIESYVQKWFELNFNYIEHLRQSELEKGNSSILIEKDKYDEAAAHLMCAFLVEKWGFESSGCTSDGIVASMYTE